MAVSGPSASVRQARRFETPLGTATEISTDLFLHHVLPPLRHDLDPTAVNIRLKNTAHTTSSSQKPITLQDRWRGFAQNPAQMKCRAQLAFRHLPEIVAAIVKAGRVGTGQFPSSITFENNPDCEMRYLNRSELASKLPDAFLFKGGRPSWGNLIVSGEHKKTDYDEDVVDVSRLFFATNSHSPD